MSQFSLERWKEQVHAGMSSAVAKMNRARTEGLPYTVYGAMAGLSLFPLVEPIATALNTGNPVPIAVYMALGHILGGMGNSLVANQVQQWVYGDKPVTHEQIAEWVMAHVPNSDQLHVELDAILAELEVIQKADQSLAEEDRAWFVETLQAEWAALPPTEQKTFTVQDGAIVYGDGNVIVNRGGTYQKTEIGIQANQIEAENIVSNGTQIVVRDGGIAYIQDEPEQNENEPATKETYLNYQWKHNRYLQLQGVRAHGRLVNIELEKIYIRLRTTKQRTIDEIHDEMTDENDVEMAWLEQEATIAPGELERRRMHGEQHLTRGTLTVSVNEALAQHQRLVVLGDPGSGKTTLLRYLTLTYAKGVLDGDNRVAEQLGLRDETDYLPIFLPLRQLGQYLAVHHPQSDGTDGHIILFDFLLETLRKERIDLPHSFYDPYLEAGKAVVLLDGMDEVATLEQRQRVARIVEAFVRAYPDCRYVVTSRIVGYEKGARLGEGFTTTTVREFTLQDIEQFLTYWQRAVAVSEMGITASEQTLLPTVEARAQAQTQKLLRAIKGNKRIRELAINPLLLTVIALVHKESDLPDRRAKLYQDAIEMMLGQRDNVREIKHPPILATGTFENEDKRLMLQAIALHMHEAEQKEIEQETLTHLLTTLFRDYVTDEREAVQATARFLQVIQARAGLLTERDTGLYAFSHLTFQEYLVALAVAARDDYIAYSCRRVRDAWWREVILLEAGHLSMQSREKPSKLIRALVNVTPDVDDPYAHLVLAAHCLRDVGSARIDTDLITTVQSRLRKGIEKQPPRLATWLNRSWGVDKWIEQRGKAMEALVEAGAGYWSKPDGEPEWVEIPAGAFVMGSDTGKDHEKPQHTVTLPTFHISRVPITNAQYYLFTQDSGHTAPNHWEDDRPPKHVESHPVIYVSWRDAMAYCAWLSGKIGKVVTLPSEAEWEKAARGTDGRTYPWGNRFDRMNCNSKELGLNTTTPVGIFPQGESPYGVLDMSGNVWEWTRSRYGRWTNSSLTDVVRYPYDPNDGREQYTVDNDILWTLRGGAFWGNETSVRCASRLRFDPNDWYNNFGFRIVLSPLSLLPSTMGDGNDER